MAMNQGLLGNLNLKFEFQQVDYLPYLFSFHGEHIHLICFGHRFTRARSMPTFESLVAEIFSPS